MRVFSFTGHVNYQLYLKFIYNKFKYELYLHILFKLIMIITTSVSSELIERLNDYSKRFKMTKSKMIEQALENYFEKIQRAEYVRSFRNAASDREVINMAEEGLEDYLKILEDHETA